MPRIGLRGKFLTLTALPLLALAAATLWLVDRGVTTRSEQALAEDLRRAADLFEDMLSASAAELDVTGAVIVRDPRFFAVLALPHRRNAPDYVRTVAGVAQDFQRLAHPDLFEVVDEHGDVVASVGRLRASSSVRDPIVKGLLGGRTDRRAVAQKGVHVLMVATPVLADGRVIGGLLLGREVSGGMAARLRELTNSEVSFVYERHLTRTTLDVGEARDVAARMALRPAVASSAPVLDAGWIAYARRLPMAAEGTSQMYVLQRSFRAETEFVRSVRAHLIELGLLLLVAVVFASSFISAHLTRPIRQMVLAAEAMESGDFEAPLDRERPDEMGYLASRFDDMRKRQRTYVDSLREVARAKSEFIAVASHELRTPISIIRGWEDLLRSGLVEPGHPRFTEGLDAIGRSCTALERIAVSATRMAQADSPEALATPERTTLEPLIAEALREAAGAAPERRVTLSMEVQPAAEEAVLDRSQVLQAVDALVRNGIRFTPDGGSVRVSAWGEHDDLHVAVRDTGIGLSAEARHRLFDDAYVQRDSRHHRTARGLEFNVAGMGFGLAFVRRVVEGHGGRLQVDSEEGRGSIFTMVFPAALAVDDVERDAA